MVHFADASVRAALKSDFADHIDLEQVEVRETRRRPDGLSDALRLIFGRHHREPRHGGQWPSLIPPL